MSLPFDECGYVCSRETKAEAVRDVFQRVNELDFHRNRHRTAFNRSPSPIKRHSAGTTVDAIRSRRHLWLPKTPYRVASIAVTGVVRWARLVTSVVVSLLHSLRFIIRSRTSLHLEIIAPRHQLAVVNRCRSPRRRFTIGRPAVVGVAFPGMARLALGRAHRQTGDGHRVAPARLSPVLDLEESTAHRAPGSAARPAHPDRRAVQRESSVGCAADSRGASEVGHLRESVDRCQVHATASALCLPETW
jgi:hypothetical protein